MSGHSWGRHAGFAEWRWYLAGTWAEDRRGEAHAEANLELLPGREKVSPDRKRIPEAPGGMWKTRARSSRPRSERVREGLAFSRMAHSDRGDWKPILATIGGAMRRLLRPRDPDASAR